MIKHAARRAERLVERIEEGEDLPVRKFKNDAGQTIGSE